MVSGVLPFPVSGIVPSTKTVLPTTGVQFGAESDCGANCSTSLEPETRNVTLSPAVTTVPATVAVESFIVNPFLAMASFSCLSVVVLPGFIFTTASPFSRLTSTESTPEIDFNDTRTACAQTSQSMPKILMSMDLISAKAEEASIKSDAKTADSFLINLLSVSVRAERAGS
jgi:hypothetical protein